MGQGRQAGPRRRLTPCKTASSCGEASLSWKGLSWHSWRVSGPHPWGSPRGKDRVLEGQHDNPHHTTGWA